MTDAGPNGMLEWSDHRVARVRRLCADTGVRLIIHTLSAVNVAEFVPHMTDAVDAYLAANIDLAAKLEAEVIVHAGMHFSERIDIRTRASLEDAYPTAVVAWLYKSRPSGRWTCTTAPSP